LGVGRGQLHGETAFVAIDTEWDLNRWGYGPDDHITEFGAADAEDAVLVTDLQPLPSAGPERTKKKKELRLAMEWVIAQGALMAGHSTSTSLVGICIWMVHILAPT
jgi:hypothetical protein